jgi:hypothetical protein
VKRNGIPHKKKLAIEAGLISEKSGGPRKNISEEQGETTIIGSLADILPECYRRPKVASTHYLCLS